MSLTPFVRLPCTSRAHVIVSINSPHTDTPPKSACIRPFWKRLLFGRCFSHPKRERLRNATVALQNSAQNGRCYSARYRVKKLPIFAPFFRPLYSPKFLGRQKRQKTPAISALSPFKKHLKNRYPKKSTFWIPKN